MAPNLIRDSNQVSLLLLFVFLFFLLQLWNFASGRQLQMPMEIICSALCIANNDDQAVIARCEAGSSDGFSILLWDLASNSPVNETLFMPPSGEFPSPVFNLKFLFAKFCLSTSQLLAIIS